MQRRISIKFRAVHTRVHISLFSLVVAPPPTRTHAPSSPSQRLPSSPTESQSQQLPQFPRPRRSSTFHPAIMAVVMEGEEFQHILRVLNTNIEGRQKVMYALTSIKGVGRRFSNLVLKKADVDLAKRAGSLSNEEIDRIVTIIQNPRQFKIPDYFLNRQRDFKDGKTSQLIANQLDFKMREDLDRLRKIRSHRGMRHYFGLRVRGQHTKTTGRRGRTVGVSKKKA
ncbi:unnamed protein product [Chondrus crispus]|uniref:40S ribosomal protein S18 n=1 Tax=Chondrus crispus TaxID=2769 RepID=R7QA05_CHOCR|nr:unnamed protein product [Chondrus crispus]CDF34241.1 unnamed protein product [Chondrus crispus]|eukprot:XP_005714060.1 unnamed protein product [Chondrus crispus]